MATPTTTPFTAPFDVFSEISGWFGTNWTDGSAPVLSTVVDALQLGASTTKLQVTGKVNGTKNTTTNVIEVTYGEISFMNVKLLISHLKIDPTTYTLSLTATALATSSGPFNLSDSVPGVYCLKLIEGLIANPSFTYELEATSGNNGTIKKSELTFDATISTSGSNLGDEASDFIAFFGKTGVVQQFLYAVEGGAIGDGIDLSGSIDFADPIQTVNGGSLPNLQLTASLNGSDDSFTLFDCMTVQKPRLSFTTVPSKATDPTSGKYEHAAIVPTFDMDLIIGSGPSAVDLTFSAGAPPVLSSMNIKATNDDAQSITLTQIFALMHGSSWAGMIPAPLQDVLNDVGLQSFSANIGFPDASADEPKFDLQWLTVEVESTSSLTLEPPLSDSKVKAVWTILNPRDPSTRSTSVDFYATSQLTIGSASPIDLAISIQD